MPYPTLPEASGFRWGLPYLLPTPLGILQEVSRVHTVRLKRDDIRWRVPGALFPRFAAP